MSDGPVLYSARDVARIFGMQETRVNYWARTGVVGPSVRRGARAYYTFRDLITFKTAKELLDRGLTLQAVRKNLGALRASLPDVEQPLAELRVISDGNALLVLQHDRAFDALSGQLVMDFAVGALWNEVARVMELRPSDKSGPVAEAPAPSEPTTAYAWFERGCELEDAGAPPDDAAAAYARAIALDPALAAAHNNLGSLEHRRGRRGEARACFERALALDPEQPEARYNLGNLHDELGEPARAIAEWTRVLALAPDFADAEFNLGAALARAGDGLAARLHLERYLRLDGTGAWAEAAEALLASIDT